MELNTNALPPLFAEEPLLWGDSDENYISQDKDNDNASHGILQEGTDPVNEGTRDHEALPTVDTSPSPDKIVSDSAGSGLKRDNHAEKGAAKQSPTASEDDAAEAEVNALFESVQKEDQSENDSNGSKDDRGVQKAVTSSVPDSASLKSNLPEITYTVKDVAVRLGTTPQTIRNYSDGFDSILHVRRGENGQRLYTEETIKMIATIIEFKNTRRMTDDEVKAHFGVAVVNKAPDDKAETPLNGQDVEKIAALVTESVQERIRAFFEIGLSDINKKMDQLASSSARLSEIVLLQEKHLEKLSEGNSSISTSIETLSSSQNEGLIEILNLLEKLTAQKSEESVPATQENEEILEKAKLTIKNLAKELTIKENMITALMEEIKRTQNMKSEPSSENNAKAGANIFPYNDVQDKKQEEPKKKKKRFWFF